MVFGLKKKATASADDAQSKNSTPDEAEEGDERAGSIPGAVEQTDFEQNGDDGDNDQGPSQGASGDDNQDKPQDQDGEGWAAAVEEGDSDDEGESTTGLPRGDEYKPPQDDLGCLGFLFRKKEPPPKPWLVSRKELIERYVQEKKAVGWILPFLKPRAEFLKRWKASRRKTYAGETLDPLTKHGMGVCKWPEPPFGGGGCPHGGLSNSCRGVLWRVEVQ